LREIDSLFRAIELHYICHYGLADNAYIIYVITSFIIAVILIAIIYVIMHFKLSHYALADNAYIIYVIMPFL